MGGLRLDDFSEGAAGAVARAAEDDVATYDSDDSTDPCKSPTVSPTDEHGRHELTDLPVSLDSSATPLSPSMLVQAPADSPSSPITAVVYASPVNHSSEEMLSETEEGNSEFDALPVPRAGTAIHAFATFSPIRALASPYRSPPRISDKVNGAAMLSPPPQFGLPGSPVGEGSLHSPTQTVSQTLAETPMAARTPRQLCPLPTTATPSRAREAMVPLVDRGAKTLKSQPPVTSTSSQSEPSLIPLKDRNRALAVRGKLSAVFAGRPGVMGPPQRAVSSSSSLSSSGSNGRSTSQAVPERSTVRKVARPTGAPIRPASSMARLPPVSTLGKSAQASSFRSGIQPKSLSSSLSTRPVSAIPTTSSASTRPALAPRSIITHPPKQPISRPIATKIARPMPVMPVTVPLAQPQTVSVTAPKNPLKRPFQAGTMAPSSRQAITTSNGPRPALGLPSRLVWDAGQSRPTPVFHIGAAPAQTHMAQIAMKSPARQATGQRAPGTPSASRTAPVSHDTKKRMAVTDTMQIGTPSKPNGTPRTIRAKPSFQMMSVTAKPPIHDVAEVAESSTTGPPSTSTRHASDRQASPSKPHDEAQRGSSADHEDVSMQLARPPSSSTSPPSQTESPSKKISPRTKKTESSARPTDDHAQGSPSGSRPKRAAALPPTRGRSTLNTPAAPWMSGKELKTTTDRNTMRNQVYLCAIDRQVVHVPGPRPPSPTSKIRTTADRDEEEKKKSREHRAKRRGTSGQEGSPERPVIEKVERARGPGDEEDWKTPARPAKKAKTGIDKSVKWDRQLVIIRDDGSGVCPPTSEGSDEPKRSCVRSKVGLLFLISPLL